MKIQDSKNLKYDKFPWIRSIEEYEKLNPKNCFLNDFSQVDDKIILYFKNSSQVIIKAINIEGGKEIDLIGNKLPEFLGKSYEEILNTNF